METAIIVTKSTESSKITGSAILAGFDGTDTAELIAVDTPGGKIIATDKELVITAATATPDECDALHNGVNTSADSILFEIVILPYNSELTPKDYHTAGRNLLFIPQQPESFTDEKEYYKNCASEAIKYIRLIKRLADSTEKDNVISFDRSDLISMLKCDKENFKFVIRAEGNLDRCINTLKNHSLVNSDTAALLMMSYLPMDTTIDDYGRLGEINDSTDRIISGLDLIDGAKRSEIIALGVNRF